MNKYLKGWVAASLLLGATSPAFAQLPSTRKAESGLAITVHVYNYAQVPAERLAAAESVAARVFQRTGIDIAWVEGPIAPTHASNAATVANPLGPLDIILRIVPRSMAQHLKLEGDSLGVALPDSDGVPSCYALVFYDRVKDLATDQHSNPALVLGHVIAHEFGHLFLGSGAHSSTGIMRPRWSRRELQAAELNELLFSAGQRERIHTSIQSRNTGQ